MTHPICNGRALNSPTLWIVVPCYNEQAALDKTTLALLIILDQLQRSARISAESRVYYVDDGSDDGTWQSIRGWSDRDARVSGLRLSRNVGHQNALLAGLFSAEADIVVTMDADLQDDVNVIENMVTCHAQGMDVVYGVRNDRLTDTFVKRTTAGVFYWLMQALGTDILRNHADFRLLSRRAVDCLRQFNEVNLFLRGMVRLVGLPSSVVYYQRRPRVAGESKYPVNKMLAFALDGVTSFSAVPLRMISWAGFALFASTLAMSCWVLYVKYYLNLAVPGWASTVLPVYFISGVQILSTGIIGEYLAKVYLETKRRPRYFVQERTEIAADAGSVVERERHVGNEQEPCGTLAG